MAAPHATSSPDVFVATACRVLAALLLILCSACGEQRKSADPAQEVTQGWKDYDAALYDNAERLFADAAGRTAGSADLYLRALYGQATTINLRRPGGDPARARSLYQEIIRLAPKSDFAAWSLLALARIVHLPTSGEKPALDAVVAAYQPVIDQFPFHHAGEEAFTFQQSARVASFRPEEERRAAELMERFVADHPDSVFRCHVYYELSHAYDALGEPERAVAAMVRYYELYHLDPKNPRSDYAGVYWNIATLANYRAGDFATARRFYELLIKEYPTERRVFTAKLALRTMDETETRLRAGLAAPAPQP